MERGGGKKVCDYGRRAASRDVRAQGPQETPGERLEVQRGFNEEAGDGDAPPAQGCVRRHHPDQRAGGEGKVFGGVDRVRQGSKKTRQEQPAPRGSHVPVRGSRVRAQGYGRLRRSKGRLDRARATNHG